MKTDTPPPLPLLLDVFTNVQPMMAMLLVLVPSSTVGCMATETPPPSGSAPRVGSIHHAEVSMKVQSLITADEAPTQFPRATNAPPPLPLLGTCENLQLLILALGLTIEVPRN